MRTHNKYRHLGTMRFKGFTVHVPSGKARELLECFAPVARRPGGTLVLRPEVVEDQTLVLSGEHTCINGSANRGDGDYRANMRRWVMRAVKRIGGGKHKADITSFGTATWEPLEGGS